MELRPYRAEDLDALHAMDKACFAPRFRFSRSLLARLAGGAGSVALLACLTGRSGTEEKAGFCIATVSLERNERIGYLATLDVMPTQRRQGLGRRLLEATEAALRTAGVRSLWLHVAAENVAAQRLYGEAGYRREGLERDFYAKGLHAWRLSKPLDLEVDSAP